MRACLESNPGKEFFAQELDDKMKKDGHTDKSYKPQDISAAKRYLIRTEKMNLTGSHYRYEPIEATG